MTHPLDVYAADLADLGLLIASRIRDEGPDAVARCMDGMTAEQLRHLVLVLAAHVPIDLPRSVLTGWWTRPEVDADQVWRSTDWVCAEYERVGAP